MLRPVFHPVLLLLLCAIGCTVGDSTDIDATYKDELAEWRQARLEQLRKPRGWPALIALHWLEEGKTSFGSTADDEIQLPVGSEHLGVWSREGALIQFIPAADAQILSGDTLFQSGSVNTDRDAKQHLFRAGPLYWTVIKRSDSYGVRVWDTTSNSRTISAGIPHYPASLNWQVEVQVEETLPADSITLSNAVGMNIRYPLAGYVTGRVNDADFRLAALNLSDNSLFLIISDMTTDIETYASGRYLYIPLPDSIGRSMIDFNKAINPPCAFTDFATCLRPPDQNFIPVEINAGEKLYAKTD